jgi:2-methylcitrate dehydratase
VKGSLTAEDYEDATAADPRIDACRAKMEVVENADFTRDYLDPAKRSIGNAIRVFFQDGTSTDRVAVEYPLGHARRRTEGIPVLLAKFEANLRGRIAERKSNTILDLFADAPKLESTPVVRLMDLLAV